MEIIKILIISPNLEMNKLLENRINEHAKPPWVLCVLLRFISEG